MNLELATHSPPIVARTSGRSRPLLLGAGVLAILTFAIALRTWRLGNIPGLNGDEAWSGVQAMRLATGQSFAWRTPTGNPANPFYLGPLAALHLWLGPSTTVLRIPALVSGLAALAANFLLCRRTFGSTAAWVSSLILAVLPLNIAYSRFAWDASQTLLAVTLLVYAGLACSLVPGRTRSSLVPALLAYAAAIWVHPTNLFAGWLVLIPAVEGHRAEIGVRLDAFRSGRLGRLAQGRGIVVALALMAILAGTCVVTAPTPLGPLALAALRRASDPAEWGLFLQRLVQLLSGNSVFQFIAGPKSGETGLDALDLVALAVIGIAAAGLVPVLKNPGAVRERSLAWATLGMTISFYLVAGPAAIAPHAERYGVCLVAPLVTLVALGWTHWLAPGRPLARPLAAALILLACGWLGVFSSRYFGRILTTGGQSHVAFRTAAVEPKQAAWDWIVAHRAGRPIQVEADSWWTYWPLAYLSAADPTARIVGDIPGAASMGPEAADEFRVRVGFCAAAADTRADATDTAPPAGPALPADPGGPGGATVISDFSGRPLLVVERLSASAANVQGSEFDMEGK